MFGLLIAKLAGLMALTALGYIFIKRNLLDGAAISGLAWLVIDVTMPALFFSSVLKSGFSIENKALIVAALAGILVGLSGFLLGISVFSFFPLETKQKGALCFDTCVGNSSFLPLPLCYALWGEQGGLYCLAYVLGNNVFLFTLGIGLLRGGTKLEKADILRIFLHPQALGFVMGWAWSALNFPYITWLFDPAEMLGKATLPLAMLCTGAILAQAPSPGKGSRAPLATAVALKLLALPCLALVALKPLKNGPFGGVLASVILLQAAMPSLASAGVYARRFGGDAALAAQGSLYSTLLCPLTLPLWMGLWQLI